MFLSILPLKSRLLRWPLATIILLVVTLGYSLKEFSVAPARSEALKGFAAQSQVWGYRRGMVQKLCPTVVTGTVGASQCGYLNSSLQDVDFLDLTNFFASYKKKFPEDHGAEFKKWAQWLSNEESFLKLEPEAKSDPSVVAYTNALKIYRGLIAASAKEHQTLVRGNLRVWAAVKSVFSHTTWTELLASLVATTLLAFYLEQRVGPLGIVLIYVVAGIGGNILQAASAPYGVAMFGSLAAVCGLLGAFLTFFYQEKSHLRVNFGFYNRSIAFPTWSLLLGVWIGLSTFAFLGSSALGFISEVAGFALGAIAASMQKDLFPLKQTFLFPQEQRFYYDAKKSARFDEKMAFFRQIDELNHESFYAFRSLFAYFEKHRLALTSFRDEDREFIRCVIAECIQFRSKNEKYEYSQQVLGRIPLWWNLTALEMDISADDIIDRADKFQEKGHLVQGLRFYDLFLEKFAAHPRAQRAHSVIMQVFDELEKLDPEPRIEMLQILIEYAKAHPTTHFQSQIRQLIRQTEKGRARGAA